MICQDQASLCPSGTKSATKQAESGLRREYWVEHSAYRRLCAPLRTRFAVLNFKGSVRSGAIGH